MNHVFNQHCLWNCPCHPVIWHSHRRWPYPEIHETIADLSYVNNHCHPMKTYHYFLRDMWKAMENRRTKNGISAWKAIPNGKFSSLDCYILLSYFFTNMSFPDGKTSLVERIDQVFTSDGVELFRNAKRELWALEAQRATGPRFAAAGEMARSSAGK